jgi:hypothetical protein
MKKIIFVPHDKRCGKEIDMPTPAAVSIENWYKDAHKFETMNGEPASLEDAKSVKAFATFKNCVPFFDGMSAGYTFNTPCDITFYKDDIGITRLKMEESYEKLAGYRGPAKDFVNPEGYEKDHFFWYPAWSVKLPEGYSALYINPMNRSNLPFLTFGGIIDNDKLSITGQFPFILKKDFIGVVPKGTPFIQIIPFKRDDWESEMEERSNTDIILSEYRGGFKYRKEKVNVYRDKEWSRKKFK